MNLPRSSAPKRINSPSARKSSMLKRLLRKVLPNPLDSLLHKAVQCGHKRFLLAWNRGLGDIPLGLYATVYRIRELIPEAEVTFVTRKDLLEGFEMLEGVEVLASGKWKRRQPFSLQETVEELGRSLKQWDVVIEAPDPTYWVKWQLGRLIPKLKWDPLWDSLCERFSLHTGEKYIGVHVQTETGANYGYEKNWPLENFQKLFESLKEKNCKIILFGFSKEPSFSLPNLIDLRGETTMREMLSIIKNRCSHLIVPDSGVLSMSYFIDLSFDLKIVSLWSDPYQGVLKQNVASPNPRLYHRPLIAPQGDLRQLPVEAVIQAMFSFQEA